MSTWCSDKVLFKECLDLGKQTFYIHCRSSLFGWRQPVTQLFGQSENVYCTTWGPGQRRPLMSSLFSPLSNDVTGFCGQKWPALRLQWAQAQGNWIVKDWEKSRSETWCALLLIKPPWFKIILCVFYGIDLQGFWRPGSVPVWHNWQFTQIFDSMHPTVVFLEQSSTSVEFCLDLKQYTSLYWQNWYK